MTLEQLIYEKLTSDAVLAGRLAVFAGRPALFERQAPADADPGWAGPQYPRIDYGVDRAEEPERRVEGRAAFNVWCLTDSQAMPEDVERRLRELLDGAVFHPADEPVTALRWSRSDGFESARGEHDELVLGVSVLFDLLAFPSQATFSPDPVAALNAWTETALPELQVDPTAWAPTDANPAVYWRVVSLEVRERTAAVAWVQVAAAGHVLAPTPAGRLPWIRRLCERLATDGRTALDDGSPLLFCAVAADGHADPLRTGQVRLTARFGVLQPAAEQTVLGRAVVGGDVSGEVT